MPKRRIISVFMLAMINVAAICNIANLPISAEYGFSAILYYIIAAFLFFIPVSFISAELATAWPQTGGVYIWVREALGERLGFLAVWLQWVENIIWYPTALSYTAATFAYVFNPELAQNPKYIMITILVTFWAITLINFLGMKISGWISTLCAVIGTLIPGLIIISLGASWIALGNPMQIDFNKVGLFSNFSFSKLTLIAGILLSFGGMEMSAVHAKEVENPQKNYPKAIFLSSLIILTVFILGSLSIAIVVPNEKIIFAAGTIEAIKMFLFAYHIEWVAPVIAALMTFGALGMISTWTVGPTKGILATAYHGELPPLFQKTNKKNMPITILIFQAIIVSILSIVFLLMPTVTSSYWILYCLTAQLYLIMYALMFLSGIVLRYKRPNVKRHFKVPFKNVGMWIIASLGIVGSVFAIIAGFFPPEQFQTGNPIFYVGFLMGGIIVFSIIPIIIHQFKKPKWNKHLEEKLNKPPSR